MRLKRLISCLLSAALLAGLLVFPPASASGSGGFSDISDSTVADAAEMLRLLGVVDGTGGGAFNPGGTLSRAEFCKMTVEINSYHFVLLDQRLEGADFLMDIVYQGYYGICTYLIAAGEFRHAEERAAVLRSGADVCICAPVSPDELYEQISAVTRRQHRQMRHSLAGPSSLPILKFTNLSIDPIRNAVMSSGREIN